MSKRSRFILILVVLGVCFAFLWSSIGWYAFTPKDEQTLALGSLEKIKDYSHVMAVADVKTLTAAVRSNASGDVPEQFSYLEKTARKNYKLLGKTAPKTWTLGSLLAGYPTEKELITTIEAKYRDDILKAKSLYDGSVKLGLDLSGGMSIVIRADLDAALASQEGYTTESPDEFREHAMTQAIDTLKGRIDRFGLTEPVIRRQGTDRIYVEIPGAAEANQINSIVMGKGILNFRAVNTEASNSFNNYYYSNPENVFDANGNLINPSLIPEGTEVLGSYTKDDYGLDERRGYLVVDKTPVLDGKHIKSAEIGSDNVGKPQVNFVLDSEGADIFAEYTAAHVGDNLAIVSDNKIKSSATIQEAIGGGRVAISGFNLDEAQNLKKVLETAWLSVPLEIENQQVVGASLGATYIQQGLRALVIGLLLVLIFMIVYYHAAGINAVIAQILNIYIMFSVLSALGLTLTLAGIAGMILTIGMAVDANVIIFERIREELRLGKTRAAAISIGFKHAFWAIMDSNITTFIAAFFLSILGNGSVQGFAVTLAIGVVSSVFTALFVSRLMFDFDTEVLHREKLSIGWGIKQ